MLGDIARQHGAHKYPHRAAGGKDRKRAGERFFREHIRQHGVRGRDTAGFSRAHSQAREGKLPRSNGHAAQAGHHAPDRQTGGENGAAAVAVRPTGDRQRQNRVEESKAQSADQAHDRVRDPELFLDRIEQQAEDSAVGVVQHIDENHHAERVVRFVSGSRATGSFTRRACAHAVDWCGPGLHEKS